MVKAHPELAFNIHICTVQEQVRYAPHIEKSQTKSRHQSIPINYNISSGFSGARSCAFVSLRCMLSTTADVPAQISNFDGPDLIEILLAIVIVVHVSAFADFVCVCNVLHTVVSRHLPLFISSEYHCMVDLEQIELLSASNC